jgi:cyclohexa-1,5-dienecarbonyl-CoA hydratase
MESRFIDATVDDGIATLTLDRPPVNVLNIAMLRQLQVALEELAGDEAVRVLVLEAEGKLFSAGVDVADHTAEKVGEMIPLFDAVCRHLAAFRSPTIAAVHGHALGGGCELVLCCDLSVMSEAAKIGQPEIHLGVFAPVAAMRLPYLTGYATAAELLFSGRNLNAQDALSAGLVSEVVPAADVKARAQKRAAHLAGMSGAALSICKKALNIGFGAWAQAQPEMERLYLEELMETADAQEGLEAFVEKRAPVWAHR